MKEKIVVLGNGNDWCEKSLNDFKKLENVKVINSKYLCNLNKLTNILAKIHFSHKINEIINLPFKSLWFKKIRNNISDNNDENIIIIIYDRSIFANNVKFLKYLRKSFVNCKLVYLFTNIVKISGASDNKFVDKLNDYYDIVYAFDPSDAPKYNFNYHPLLYSLNKTDNLEKKDQVFYVGRAKDRFPMLLKIYEKLENLGINNEFYIFGVSEEEQKHQEKIKYNQFIPYSECLKRIQESNCLLDIIQGDSEGFTIKVCEAVYYDKLLITTNKNVKDTPFYDEKYILVIESEDDIKSDFFKTKNVHYKKEGKDFFSVETFLKKLEKDLIELESKKVRKE